MKELYENLNFDTLFGFENASCDDFSIIVNLFRIHFASFVF